MKRNAPPGLNQIPSRCTAIDVSMTKYFECAPVMTDDVVPRSTITLEEPSGRRRSREVVPRMPSKYQRIWM